MALPGGQDELVRRVARVNPRTVVVVNAGSAIEMPWLEDVAAVLHLWYPGQALGDALAALLSGSAAPSGRLPTTFYRRVEDSPSWPHYPGAGGEVHYGEGLHVGHRAHGLPGSPPPLFPFGYGLTYTSFGYGEPTLHPTPAGWDVHVPVTNTGARAGREVVQVYLRELGAQADRPTQALVGWAALTLASGRRGTAVVPLQRSALRRRQDGRWVPLTGAAELLVAADAGDVRARLPLDLDRT